MRRGAGAIGLTGILASAVPLRASAVDDTAEEATGAVVEGSRATRIRFEASWTFVRPVGPHPWQLGAIRQRPA